MSHGLIITIDGPAGSGKSTIASGLARRLGAAYLDTGAMYRAVTLLALEKDLPLDNPAALTDAVKNCRIELACDDAEALDENGHSRIWLDGREVTSLIRSQRVTERSHKLASVPSVREQLVRQQQQIGQTAGKLVTEGRDQGTVVFPDAAFKFYLDASADCRARRRWEQLKKQGIETSFEEVLAAQQQRDQRDRDRRAGPLVAAPDAIRMDTTGMTIQQVIERLVDQVEGYLTR